MHNIVVSKIRCESPNKKNTAIINRNSLTYIATREGVDLTPSEMSNPETYVKYIHERPRSHGLFGNLKNEEISDLTKLASTMYLISKEKVIYRGILSLDERDAIELGYNHKSKWESLMKSTLPSIADKLGKISIDKLKWVAAVHMEKGHPHVHYMIWDSADRIQKPFIHKTTQGECRELFSGFILKEEKKREAENRYLYRESIVEFGKDIISKEKDIILKYLPDATKESLPKKIKSGDLDKLTINMMQLAASLPTKGSIKYRLDSPEIKKQTTAIVDLLLEISEAKKMFNQFIHAVDNVTRTYSVVGKKEDWNREKAIKDLYSRLGNPILKAAKELRMKGLDFEILDSSTSNRNAESDSIELSYYSELADSYEDSADYLDLSDSMDHYLDLFLNDQETSIPEPIIDNPISSQGLGFVKWSKSYKNALTCLYETYDFPKALILLKSEFEKGNALATHDLGKIYESGLGIESDLSASKVFYTKALNLFNEAYTTRPSEYVAYRIGKLYASKKTSERSIEQAITWYKKASTNQDAQYSLAQLYMSEDNYKQIEAIDMLKKLADDGHQISQYQLGRLYYKGNVIAQNIHLATHYLKLSSLQDNSFAQYTLGKIYLDKDSSYFNFNEAFNYLLKSSVNKNQFAQYQIGLLYYKGEDISRDIDVAIKYLELSALQGNDFAEYTLGKIYADQESPLYNIEKAIDWFFKSAKKDNQFAMFQLGAIYLWGRGIVKDESLGKYWLNLSSQQGNKFADSQLKAYENYKIRVATGITYRLCNTLISTLSNESYKRSSLNNENSRREKSKQTKREEAKQYGLSKEHDEPEDTELY